MAGLWVCVRAAGAAVWLAVAPAFAQDLSALARVDVAASRLADSGDGITLDLALTTAVPWRVRLADDPARVILDFREVDWAALPQVANTSRRVTDLAAGRVPGGWSRLVLTLDAPHRVASAEMRTATDGSGSALVRLRLSPTTAEAFAARAAQPDPAAWSLPPAAVTTAPRTRQKGEGPLVVVLDPGHGGIDPGAEHGGLTEADLMLRFARDLKEALTRAGGFEVVLTRDADVFVPLDARVAIAHAVGADVFLSLHADAVAEGVATGATIYTLSERASDAASAALAERHDRDNVLAGVSLSGQDDLVAKVLMDLARVETAPRSDRLSAALAAALTSAGVKLHKVPRRGAAFSVLRAPDIPSVLIELGYLSSSVDRRRLSDPEWTARVVSSILVALQDWAIADAAEGTLLRQ